MHGRFDKTQCCPHGLTRLQGPPNECCVDDLEKTPYRMHYLQHTLKSTYTDYTFDVQVVDPTNIDFDGVEQDDCDKMTMDSASIQICEWWEGGGACLCRPCMHMASIQRPVSVGGLLADLACIWPPSRGL